MALTDTAAGQQLQSLHAFALGYARAGYEYAQAVLEDLTVGQVIDLLDQAIAAIRATDWQAVYNDFERSGAFDDPAFDQVKAIFQQLIDDDFTIFDGYFNTVRNELSGLDPNVPIVDAFGIEIPSFDELISKIDVTALAEHLSVVASSYQFFIDKVPFEDGVVSLIDPGVNTNGLAGEYYAQFNVENKYINFASNLAVEGEGNSFFASEYGNLNFRQAVEKAYDSIVGNENAPNGELPAALAFFFNSEGYYRQVAQERGVVRGNVDLEDATTIVMIGSMLNEANKTDSGFYGEAIEDFIEDVFADGQSTLFGQDLFALGG